MNYEDAREIFIEAGWSTAVRYTRGCIATEMTVINEEAMHKLSIDNSGNVAERVVRALTQ